MNNVTKGFGAVFLCGRIGEGLEIGGHVVVTEGTKGPVVAVIDDDPDLRATVAALLAENGFMPVPLADGAAFAALGDDPGVDLALIDLRLGHGENGLALAVSIRQRLGLPIVMLTGRGDEMDKIIGLETGADDYMMKPFNPRELIASGLIPTIGTPDFWQQ